MKVEPDVKVEENYEKKVIKDNKVDMSKKAQVEKVDAAKKEEKLPDKIESKVEES